MKAIVICPDRRSEVTFLARKTPLALVPVLGPSVLTHWLTALAERGAKEIIIIASDRPNQVRTAVGRGERWGLKIEVLAEALELSVAEAQKRFGLENVVVADHLPALPEKPLFKNYAGFFNALKAWLPHAGKARVGVREIAPGVWAGLGCKIEASAKIIAPCWLGENVWVRNGANVGPDAFIEDAAMVDNDAEITAGWIGQRTYVGALTQVRNSFAWADGLLNHTNGSFTEIVDAFLLGDLQGKHGFERSSPWYGQLAALLLLVFTSPLLVFAWIKNGGSKNLLVKMRAVVPTAVTGTQSLREMGYFELNCFRGRCRRWPQLWSIAHGDFTWVGNRPLTRVQAAQLETEFEQLWLAAPIGFFSLADVFGSGDAFDDETRAHSSYYAVRASGRLDRNILHRILLRSSQKV